MDAIFNRNLTRAQNRAMRGKPMRPDTIFPSGESGKRTRELAISFTAESSELNLVVPKSIRDVVRIQLSSLLVINPFVSLSSMNSALVYYVIDPHVGGGTDPITNLSANLKTHYIILEQGDFDPTELVRKLNAALLQRHGHNHFTFEYSTSTHKLTLKNTHATSSFYIPKKTSVDALLEAAPIRNAVGSAWATLGFPVDADDIELRSQGAQATNVGINSSPATLPVEFLNTSSISFLIPDDDPANAYSAITASFTPGSTLENSNKSALIAEQFLLINTYTSQPSSKKAIYLCCPGVDSSHEVVSSAQTTQTITLQSTMPSGTIVNGVKSSVPIKLTSRAASSSPLEAAVNLDSVLAVIPVLSGKVELDQFSSIPIDLVDSPIKSFKKFKMILVNEEGERVDLRGRTLSGTLTLSQRY